jgi:hypothetical protein
MRQSLIMVAPSDVHHGIEDGHLRRVRVLRQVAKPGPVRPLVVAGQFRLRANALGFDTWAGGLPRITPVG